MRSLTLSIGAAAVMEQMAAAPDRAKFSANDSFWAIVSKSFFCPNRGQVDNRRLHKGSKSLARTMFELTNHDKRMCNMVGQFKWCEPTISNPGLQFFFNPRN